MSFEKNQVGGNSRDSRKFAFTDNTTKEIMQWAIYCRKSGEYKRALLLLEILNDQLITIQPKIEKLKCLVECKRNFDAREELEEMIKAFQINESVSQSTSMLYSNLEEDLEELNQIINLNANNNLHVEFLLFMFDFRLRVVIGFYAKDENRKLEKLIELTEEIQTDLPKTFDSYKVKLLEDILESIFDISEARIEDKFTGAQTLLSYLGDIFCKENDFSKAKDVYLQKVVLLRMMPMKNFKSWNESLGKAYYKLGLMQDKCGEYHNAQKSFDNSKKYFPDNQDIKEVSASSIVLVLSFLFICIAFLCMAGVRK